MNQFTKLWLQSLMSFNSPPFCWSLKTLVKQTADLKNDSVKTDTIISRDTISANKPKEEYQISGITLSFFAARNSIQQNDSLRCCSICWHVCNHPPFYTISYISVKTSSSWSENLCLTSSQLRANQWLWENGTQFCFVVSVLHVQN